MRNPSKKQLSQAPHKEEILSSLSIAFEDKVMEDIQKIVIARKVRKDRIIAMVFTSLTCIAIFVFCLLFNEIGKEMLPLMAKQFYMLIQGIMVAVFLILIQTLIDATNKLKRVSLKPH